MRRSVWIFLASIFLPSLGLAWLAVRSVQDQQVVLEHQQVIISQNITDALAKDIEAQMGQIRSDFVKTTQQLLGENASPQVLAQNFNRTLRDAWPMAEIGFAVNLDGEIYSPNPYDGPEARTFRDENDRFLTNRENVEVYSSNSSFGFQNILGAQNNIDQFAVKLPSKTADVIEDKEMNQNSSTVDLQTLQKNAGNFSDAAKDQQQAEDLKVAALKNTSQIPAANQNAALDFLSDSPAAMAHAQGGVEQSRSGPDTAMPASAATASGPLSLPPSGQMAVPATPAASPVGGGATISPTTTDVSNNALASSSTGMATLNFAKVPRQVIPQKMLNNEAAQLSNSVPEESDFRRVIGTETSGALARFLEDKLRLMVWSHPSADAPIVFGAQLDKARVVDELKAAFQIPELTQDGGTSRSGRSEICVAILDDTGQPVALSLPGFEGDWKHPFVATEIGEVLPHWEAALYLVDPEQIGRAARTLQATLGLIVLLLVAAIVSGGSLVAADVRRQMRLAQQKTDFVSNVSHELKTPLTSIRMFADLLAEKRVPDEERQATYLRIIAAEAARLTRLINNVLDFARQERGAPPGEHRACDLVNAARDVVETCGPHLEAAGISFQCEIEAESLPIRGDQDALAQIILNLVSNAEKYGGSDVLVRVRRQETSAGALGCVDMLDRGPGIPAKQVRTVFEPFQRLDDSLSSGIPGSGLGLTLARRMARAHGGDVTYSARAGGGSCFTLTVPLEAAA